MAQKDPCNASKGINSEFKTINATCSCMKCDSMYCFSKRHDVGSCSCENCKESKTCLFYNNKMVSKESHSHTMTSARGDNIHSQHFTKDIPSRNTNSSDAMTNTYDPWKYTSGLCKNELGIPKSTFEPRKNTCASCTTDAMTNTYSETPKHTHNEAPKNTYYEASKNILGICKNVLGTPRSTSESWKTTKPLQDNKHVMPNNKSEPNCDCEDPWNTIEQPDNKYSRKANCECDPWNTIERPGNKYFAKKQYFCDCIEQPKNRPKGKQIVSNPPGYIMDIPKLEPADMKNKFKPDTRLKQMDTINIQKNKCLPNADDCNCKEPTTTLKLSINVPYATPNNQIETQRNTYITQKNNCNCKTSTKRESPRHTSDHTKYKHDPSNNRQRYCTNKLETKTFEILNKTFQQKLFDCNDLLRNFNTSELPGYVLDLPKRSHKKDKLELCKNILENQRDAINTLNQMYLPQKSSCTCNEIQTKISKTEYNFESQQHSNHKHNIIEKLENKYLQEKEICICDGSLKNTSESKGCIEGLQKYNETFNKKQKSSCNCDDSPKSKPKSPEYVFDLQKSNHMPSNKKKEDGCKCDGSAKNTSEAPGYVFEERKSKHKPSNKTVEDCCNYGRSAKNTNEYPGYVFEVQKSKHEPTKGQDFTIKKFGGSAKTTSESPGCIELARYKHELSNKIRNRSCNCHGSGKHISEPPGFIIDIQNYKHEPSNKTRKDSCNCDGSTKNRSESSRYAFELQKSKHKPSNKTREDGCNCDGSAKNTSESPGYVFEVQKSKHKPPNKTMGDCCNYGGSVKNTSESPGYIFEVQKSKHEPTKGQDFTINRFDGSAKKTSESSGCIELARYKNELSNKIRSTSCNCHGSGKHISNPPGFIFDIQKYKHEPSNKIRKESCNCDGTAKNISESSRYVFELRKSKQKPSNQIMGDCYGPTKNTSESPGYVFEVQKSKNTPSNKTREGGCNCDGSAKNTSESPGYIFEVQKSKHKPPNKTMGDCCNYGGSVKNTSESAGYVFEVQKSKHEPTKGQDFTKNRFDGSAKKTSESSGCIELARYKNELTNKIRSTSCNCHGSGKHISNPPGFIFEIQKYKHEPSNKIRKESCICDGTAKNISESSRCVFELQKSKQKPSNQIMGDCYGLTKNISESPGYVFEVQKSKHTPSNKTREGGCNCDGSAKNTSESPGYIFEVQKSKHKPPNKTMGDCCNYGGSVKNTSESPGYVFEVQKYKHEPTKGQEFTINRFDGSAKKTSESSGCIELARYKNELSNKIRSTSCNCHGSGKHISNPPGFIFEIQKYKHESSNKTRKESCNCDGTAKNISESSRYAFELQNSKQKSSNQITGDCYGPTKNTSESPGYVFEVQKSKHTPSNITREGGCNCDGSAKNTSESPGYVFEVQKSKHEPIKGQDFTINRFNGSAKTTSESPGCIELARYKHELSSKIQNRSCNCHGSGKNISEPPGFVLDIQKNKHKPSHQTQEDSCNCDKSAKHATEGSGYIFEVQQNTQASTKTQEYIVNRIEIDKTYPEISSNYNGSKIESPGYVFDLQKYKHKSSNKTQEGSCKCDGSAKNTSESPGYVFEVRKSKYEPTKVQEFTINRFDSSAKTTSESPACMQLAKYKHESTNKLRNPSCNCHGSGKHISDPPGYILEVQTSKHAPFNKTMEKRCNCDESAKDISESPGYIFEVQKYTHDSPKIKEYIINRLEIKRNTFKSLYKAHQKNDCNKDSSTNYTSKLPIYISGFHKYTAKPIKGQEFIINRVETSQNILDDPFNETHEEHSCVCDDLPNNPPNPPGYVFELQNYSQETSNKIQELLINRLEVTRNTIELLNETYQKTNIECDDLVRNISEPPGYILDLQENTIETLNNIYDNKNCVCNKPLRKISESPGYIYGLQKYKIEPSNNTQELKNILETQRITIETLNNNYTKNSFEWDNMLINVSEPPGYIFDLQKHTQEPSNDTEELNNALETLNNTYKKKTCVCNKPLRKTSESPGYIYGLQKYKQQLSNNTQELKNILETQRITIEALNNTYKNNSFDRDDFLINVSEPPGYIFDLQKHTQESSNDTEEMTNVLETFHNTHMKKICDCNKPLRKISESPGYIYGLEKYKMEPSNNTQELKNILETQRITIETLNNTYKKNSFERDDLLINVSEPPGYIFDLQEHTQEPSNDIEELTNVLETLNNTHMKKICDCNKPLRKISESPGYIYGIQKYKQEPSNNTQELKNILETQRITIETLNNNYTKNSFELDNMLINVSKPAGYIFDLQKHTQEPSNDTEEFTNVFETITNTHMKKKCDCIKPLEKIPESPGYIYGLQKYKKGKTSKSEGYIFDLPKHTNEIQRNTTETLNDTNQKNSCNCIESSKKSSISSEYILDLPKQNELTYNTQALCKNILEAQTYIIETLNNTYQKNRCNCKELSRKTSKSSEYIFDLPKHTNEISHNTQKLFKNIHETHRNTIETLNTYQKTSCNCNESSRKTSESSGFMFELPKHANELSNNTKYIFKNAHETQRDTIETLNNIYQKTSCNCDNELSRKTSESSGYMFELPKHANELSNNIQKIFKDAHETPRNTIETLNNANQKNSCNCHEPSRKTSDSSGYIFKLPKHTNELSNNTQELCKNILGGQRNTIETLNNAYQIKSCSCNGSPRKSSEMPGYILELQKYEYEPSTNTQELSRDTLETQKFSNKSKSCKCNDSSRKSSISSGYVFDLSKHTKNVIEKRKDTMENLINTSYSPLENICSSNNQMKINSLKKIYLPPKYPMNNMNDQAAPAQNVLDSRKELSPGTAMLSAEVMNLPYTDFSNSFANKQTDSSEKGTKLSRYDIFRRIKEAYKACSCKVCECIAGKPLKNDVCQCKPCECTDCTSYLNKIESKQSNTDVDVGKFPCDQCYRDHSKKVTEGITEWSTCDCKPCDCIQCVKNNAKHCDCEPCQCIECKPMMMVHKPQTLVVAPVGENIQRLACTCSPCDCLECGQGHNAASSLMHEMGTGTNRHALCRCENCLNENCDQNGVDSCKCERRNRVMSKPVEKDTHDYDIRTATVVENNPFIRSDRTGNISHDTTALFAAITNKYPSHHSNNDILSNTKSCSCEECECIACVCKEDAFNAIKSSQLFSSKKSISDINISNTSKLNTPNNCKCKICECQICDKYITQERMKRCLCVICDCINCEKELRPQYSIRKCERCFLDENHPNSTVHTVKKSEVLTTSCHQTKVQSLMLGKQRFELPISSIKRGSPTEDSSFKIRNISHYALSKHDYHEDSKQPEYTKIANRSNLNDYERRYINSMKQCDAYKQSQEKNKGKHLLKNNSIDNDISGSYYSGYSSLESSSRTSCHKDYGSITPISRNKNKSWESSCNSSGYDYPDYLIQFPKSTVETCLKDVMELDIDETIKLDKFNIIPKHHVNKTHDGSEKEKLYQANESNFIDSANSNLLATKQTEYTNEFKSRTDCSEANLHEHTWDGTPWDQKLSETGDSHKYNFELSKSLHLHLNKQFDTSNSIENEKYSAQRYSKQIPYSSFVCGVDIFNIDDDNKRVQKTLQEAKEYSLELMRLLEMYEKANQEFESVSEKLKISHESLLSGDFLERKEFFCIQRSIMGKCIDKEEHSNKVEYKLPEIHLKVPSIKENLTTTSVLRSSTKIPERTFVECENGSNLILQKRGIINLNNDIINLETPERLNTLLENNLLQQIETRLDKKETFNGNETKEEIINNYEDIIQKRLKTAYKLETAEEKRSFNENQYNQGISKKDRMNNKNLKKYSKLLKRTIIISKRISMKNSTQSESKPVFKYFVTVGTSTSSFQSEMNAKRNYEKSTLLPTITSNKDTEEECSMKKYRKCELNQIMKKLDMVFGRIEEVSVSTSTDTYGLEKDANSTYELENFTGNNEIEEAKPWPILKKNFTWNTTPYGKNKGVCIFPPLELQIKQAVQSISLQTTDPKKKNIVPHHENQALVKLQTEVTKLLDMPILQPQIPIRYPAGCSKETLNIPPKSKLELKLKETPEVSLQTKRKDVKSVANEVQYNNYTKNLQIRNYSSQSVFRLNKKKKFKSDDTVGATSRISSIGSSNSNCCCEALKVGFLGVRRVSDHTVLIKWNVPRLLTKVQGYELLVDGRAVQKIFSPSKNMAVVTCLPHTDKVLLTIRTITSSVMLTGHYPATTIIYRPRVK